MDVEILSFTDPKALSMKIEMMYVSEYVLAGPVTVGINQNGNTIYVATMIREVK